MKLNIPYLSYHVQTPNTSISTEGITCAKMIMDFYGFKPTEDMRDLLSWGNSIGACDKLHPFMIDSLVVLLRAHGFQAYKEIFRNNSFDFILANAVQEIYDREYRENGISAIVASIAESVPVMALIENCAPCSEERVVLMYGFEANKGELSGFYYHDPASDEDGEGQFISVDDFRKVWKRTAVFLDR